ncbi:hypothetical protein [Paenibacillus sp. IHBB 3054]|uniref:hypothetical protein n=1 Tax=Paenibacillus sp. IHBB 3054 TaxID=3425689 RepID=UPI003F667B1D
MDQEKAIDDLAKYLIVQYPGKHDGRFRRAAVLGRIETIVESDRSPLLCLFTVTVDLIFMGAKQEKASHIN